jgi:hypothetical protein
MPITVSTATNMRMKPARNWSWLLRELSRMGPTVGRLNTRDTRTEPEIRCGSRLPISAMKGLSDMRKGYFSRAFVGPSPFAFAVT